MIALELPDEPRWVEAHGIASDAASWQRRLGDGGAVGSDRARLVVVYGDADPETVVGLARELRAHTLLVAGDDLAAALRGSGRGTLRAILHTLPDPDTLPDHDGAVRLAADAPMGHVPAVIADELAAVTGDVWTAYVDGVPVAFACASWRSPRWFDVSVDTLTGARQLGLGTLVASTMIRAERARGREPVWGADEDNLASLRLAKRLGFVAVDELWVAPAQ